MASVRAVRQDRNAQYVTVQGWARALYWLSTPGRLPMRIRLLITMNRRNRGGFWTNIQGVMSNASDRRDVGAPASDDVYDRWVRDVDQLDAGDRRAIRAHIDRLRCRPKISVIVPVYNTPEAVLSSTLQSVLGQLYPDWELCVADDASTAPHVGPMLDRVARKDARIKILRREENGHIAAASNSAISLATGDFIALLDHDDLLAEQALYEVAVALDGNADIDILYSDEDKVDEAGHRYGFNFKPDFSLDLLLGQNMFNHLTVYRKSLVDRIGGFRAGFDGSQDYDLALRAVAATTPDRIFHIPAVLYHWRQPAGRVSFSQAYLDRCIQSSQRAADAFLNAARADPVASVSPVSPNIPWNRIRWTLPEPRPFVSIIIPTRDQAKLTRQCLSGLCDRTAYERFEVIIVDNGSVEADTHDLFAALAGDARVRVLKDKRPFNYSALNNAAAEVARGDVLLLLNNDIDVIEPNWLSEMVSLFSRPDVGIVGAKLLYGDGRVQHAGVRLGAGTFDGGPGVAGHFGLFRDRSDFGYFGSLVLPRDVSAVTGACLAIRREIYAQVGGLDDEHLGVAFNDIDLCLKVRAAGYKVLWTPFAELYHLESASRGTDLTPEKLERFHGECRFMLQKWGDLLHHDPFYNPAFNNFDSDYRLDFQSFRPKPWKSSALSADETTGRQ